MTQYRGLYIDGIIFTCKQDIDKSLRETAVYRYRMAAERFAERPTLEFAEYVDQLAEDLVNNHGLDWDEVDEIEAAAMAA